MSHEENKSPSISNKRDSFIILVILAILLLIVLWSYWLKPSFFPDEKMQYAWIYHENTLLEKIALDGAENRWQLELPDGIEHVHFIIETFKDGSIAVLEADCPDHICVKTGRVNMQGQSIACLPNKIIIKISAEDASEVEGIDG